MAEVRLKNKADRAVRQKHPWVFSGAVDQVIGNPASGEVVGVCDESGQFLAWGHYHPESQIRLRLLDWSAASVIDRDWWLQRLTSSVARRQDLKDRPDLTAYRLVFSEADLLPGLIADWYDGFVVIQALTPGLEIQKQFLAEALQHLTGARGVFERSDVEARRMEGLPPTTGLLCGEAPPPLLDILENGYRFRVNLPSGQKTGFFLDQRENRRLVARYAPDGRVLDCFSHTNGFSINALKAGAASAVRVESSPEAAVLGETNLEINGLDKTDGETVVGDVFTVLRTFRDRARDFDLIILDPPKFAPTRAHVNAASRAYKDINLLALKLLRPGGILATFSCSGGVDADLFQKIVFGAGLDARRDVQVVQILGQAADHPILLSFPESYYLKGLVCRAL